LHARRKSAEKAREKAQVKKSVESVESGKSGKQLLGVNIDKLPFT
jgi:hypothetical protein